MKCKYSILILVIAIFFFSVAGVCASEINEDAADANDCLAADNDVEILNDAEWGNFTELNTAIANSEGELKLNKNYKFKESEADQFKSGIEIAKSNYVIDGQGHTIDGAKQAGIFRITGSNVILKNINFVNGVATDGGALNGGEAQNCNFINNNASYNGGAAYNCHVYNCIFTGNTAGHDGGAVYKGSVDKCKFVKNSASNSGGAVCLADLTGNKVTNSTFTDNVAGLDGGAMWLYGTVSGCDFTNNVAHGWGGAVFYSDNAGNYREVNNCIFTGNLADHDGGAIYGAKVSNCIFTGNVAKIHGAALYNCEVSSCTFTDNAADYDRVILPAIGIILNYGESTSVSFATFGGVKITAKIDGRNVPVNGFVVSISGLNAGTHTLTVTAPEDANHNKVTKSITVTVKKTTPKITAKKKTFKAKAKTKKYAVTLNDNLGRAMKSAKVTLKVKGKTYKATTSSKGKATFKITKLNKKGKYNAVITYGATNNYNVATAKAKITIK